MTAIDDIYQDRILAHAATIARSRRLPAPHATGHAYSQACGSRISVDLRLRDGRIEDYGQEVDACALGSAAASIFAKAVIGRSPAEIRHTRERMRAMLKQGGPPPEGDFAELGLLAPARMFRNRHGSIMLALDASVRALDRLAAAGGGSPETPDTGPTTTPSGPAG